MSKEYEAVEKRGPKVNEDLAKFVNSMLSKESCKEADANWVEMQEPPENLYQMQSQKVNTKVWNAFNASSRVKVGLLED